jgi:hypothetical protein
VGDFDKDGKPEVVLVGSQHRLYLVHHDPGEATGLKVIRGSLDFNNGISTAAFCGASSEYGGGPPTVADFDGDGFPDVGIAGAVGYAVFSGKKLMDPSVADKDTLLWFKETHDCSSAVTGSSVFDFNGDGRAEVLYSDEYHLWMYDGVTGSNLIPSTCNTTGTLWEYPLVADVDNDGQADIIVASNAYAFNCNGVKTSGIRVFGSKNGGWVRTRRVWNQHAYHVTNVNESGLVPAIEPESWSTWNGRRYNTYRSNPRSFGVAPNLLISAVQFSSPGAACGMLTDELTITFQVDNTGDLRVGPGIVIGFTGDWSGFGVEPLHADAVPTPLTVVLQNSLEPGESVILSVAYDAAFNTPMILPDTITVTADVGNLANECIEDDNALSGPVESGDMLADLRIDVTNVTNECPPDVTATVFNDGSLPASDVVVRFYSGDPNQGGLPIQDFVIPGPIPAGGSAMLSETLTQFSGSALNVTVYAIVDPDDAIDECNDGNNKDAGDQAVSCAPQ